VEQNKLQQSHRPQIQRPHRQLVPPIHRVVFMSTTRGSICAYHLGRGAEPHSWKLNSYLIISAVNPRLVYKFFSISPGWCPGKWHASMTTCYHGYARHGNVHLMHIQCVSCVHPSRKGAHAHPSLPPKLMWMNKNVEILQICWIA
jgi:hypothetical protein